MRSKGIFGFGQGTPYRDEKFVITMTATISKTVSLQAGHDKLAVKIPAEEEPLSNGYEEDRNSTAGKYSNSFTDDEQSRTARYVESIGSPMIISAVDEKDEKGSKSIATKKFGRTAEATMQMNMPTESDEYLSDSNELSYDDRAIQSEYKALTRAGLYGSSLKRFIELRKSSDVKPRLSKEDLQVATQYDPLHGTKGAIHTLLVTALTGIEPDFSDSHAAKMWKYDFDLHEAKKAVGSDFTVDNIVRTGYGLVINSKPYDMIKVLNDAEHHLGSQPSEITQYVLQELVENGYEWDVTSFRENTKSRLELPEEQAQELFAEYIISDRLCRATALKAATDFEPALSQRVVKKKISEYVREGRTYDLNEFENVAEVKIEAELEDIHEGMKTLLNKGDLEGFERLGEMFEMEVGEDKIKIIGDFTGTRTEKSEDAKEILRDAVSESEIPEDILKEYAIQKRHREYISQGQIISPKSPSRFSRASKYTEYSDSLTKRTGIAPNLNKWFVLNTCKEFLEKGWYAEIGELKKLSGVKFEGNKSGICDFAGDLRCEIQETYNRLWEADKVSEMIELGNASNISPQFVPYGSVQQRFKRYVQSGSFDEAEKLVRIFKSVGFAITPETAEESFRILVENSRFEDIPILEKLLKTRAPEQMVKGSLNANVQLGRYDRLERAVKNTRYTPDEKILFSEYRDLAERGMLKDLAELKKSSTVELPSDVVQVLKDQKPHRRFAKRMSNGMRKAKEKFMSSKAVKYLSGASSTTGIFYVAYNMGKELFK